MAVWNPGRFTFEHVAQLVADAKLQGSVDDNPRIVTSRDTAAISLRNTLKYDGLPQGFDASILPFVFSRAHAAVIVGATNAKSEKHSHTENVLHVVVNGSLNIDGTELTAGNWAFVPRGVEYQVASGPLGAATFSFYSPPPDGD